MKKLLLILTLLATLLLSASTALAATSSLVDKAHLLTASERAQVQAELHAVEQKYGIRCAVVTMGSIGNTKPGIYANQLIDKVFNDGPNGNIVFLQVTDQRQWYISTDRKLKEVVVGIPGTEYISKAAVPYLKKGDEAGAYRTYAKRVGELMAYYNKHGKGWQPEKEFPWLAVVGALIVGVGVASAYKKSLIAAMSNVRREVSADAYLDQGSFALENEHDTYLYTNVTYTPKPRQGHRGAGSVSTSSSDGGHGGGGGGY
ncbi:MAG: TPM domain-containing protein [Phascolarctobacterium sp.]